MYSASKGGIYSLTHAMAVSLAPMHITVNAIAPGWIHVREEEVLRPEDHKFHPSDRVGTPEDIPRMCPFLCEPEKDFINGQTLTVDGGATVKMRSNTSYNIHKVGRLIMNWQLSGILG